MTSSGIRTLAIRGSVFEAASFVLSQGLRLASNLIVTRLLYPEAFGIAALVSIFISGLELLSDVGLQQVVVQKERGDDPDFLNTVWTMHLVRGLGLWVLALALAWPFALVYQEPDLRPLILATSVQLAFTGFSSTSFFTLRRKVSLGWINLVDLLSQLAGIVTVLTWAWIRPSVWALVTAGPVSALVRMTASHFLPVPYRNRLHWDRAIAREVFLFGRWIFAATAVYFFGRQGDRLLLGRFAGAATLGVYSIALFLAEAIGNVAERITHGVFFPIFSRVGESTTDELRRVYYRARLHLDVVSMTSLGGLSAAGPWVVQLLWDQRYLEAGWMVRILCLRVAMACVLTPCETCLVALGHPRYGFLRNCLRTLGVVAGASLGWRFFGLQGLVWGIATAEIPNFFLLWFAFRRHGLLRVWRELLPVPLFVAGFFAGSAIVAGLRLL